MNSNTGNELTSRSKNSTLETVTNTDNKQKKYMIKGKLFIR